VEVACRDHDYDLLLINLTSDQAPDACLDKFAGGRIDGLILIHIEGETPWIGELLSRGCHVVAVDYTGPDSRLDAVVFDNHAVSRVAVEHLASLGHRRIGFVGTCRQPPCQDAVRRQEGFLRSMAEMDIEVRPEWVFGPQLLRRFLKPTDVVCQTEGCEAVRHLMALGPAGPTAWLAHDDLVASSMLVALRTTGRIVPRDLSIIGVDNTETCVYLDPPLTSVRHPLEEMGRRAVDRLVACVEAPADAPTDAHDPFRVVFPPTLVARQSTGPAKPVTAASEP